MEIVIAGGGDLGLELVQYCRDAFAAGSLRGRIKGFIDDDVDGARARNPDLPVLGSMDDYAFEGDDVCIIAVGTAPGRSDVRGRLRARGVTFISVIHPTAWVSPSTRIESGCILGPFTAVSPYAELGADVLLNPYASIGHHARVGAGCMLCPYAVINGRVVLGDDVFMGSHAVVTPGVVVGRRSRIAAGTALTRDCAAGTLCAAPLPKGRVMFELD
jgi:sugar O-acyltransferase (sialic acid O-acetyltransferase NeuD family)